MRPQAGWRWLAAIAASFGFAAVILAALGAHAIPLPDAAAIRLWDTALQIHLFHTAAMLGLAAIALRISSVVLIYNSLVLALGTALFSGSLYLRAAGVDFLPTYLTPTGGLLLAATWLWLIIIFITKNVD